MTTDVKTAAKAAGTAGARPEWGRAKRIVVKIGSALLTDRATGALKADWLASLMDDVAALAKAGKEVVLVSSGAIALGRHALKLPKGALELEQSQAAAAVGQISLAHAYQELARARGLVAAQILLTLGDTEERRRYLNARHTIETLLDLKAIPVVNENDTVATDRDPLRRQRPPVGARRQHGVGRLPRAAVRHRRPLHRAAGSKSAGERLDVVTAITPEIEAMAGDAGTELSKGGMKTKIEAAKIALGAGTHMVITTGKVANPLRAIGEGARVHVVPRPVRSGDRQEALDRRPARAERHVYVDAGRREGACRRQEPAAGRRRQAARARSTAATP